MIYFDNAATTSVNDEVLNTFVTVSKNYIGNTNSIHKLGFESKKLMNAATKQVADFLNVLEDEIIFTSSSSESNNLAIKGVLDAYPKRNRIILTTILEHPSITNTLNSLKDVEVINLKLDDNYHIDIDDLKEKLKLDPVLVSIHHVNSELGIIQDIDTIGKIIKENRDLLDLLANTLLEYETLTKEQIDYLVENGKMPDEEEETNYENMSLTKLKELAKEKGVKGYSKMNKAELIKELEK